jgi:hypothetical protein
MTKHTFTATLRDGAFEVPLDVRAIFGSARPPVKMTFLGQTHRSRIAVYGGKYILGIWKDVLAAHALADGRALEVTLEHDEEPRVVTPPDELAAALKRNATARAGWNAMSFTHQREWAGAVADAKQPATRTRRVAQALEALVAKAKLKPAKPAKSPKRAKTAKRPKRTTKR